LEYATLTLEGLVNRLTGPEFNPAYFLNTISVWLLLIVLGSGLLDLFVYFAVYGVNPNVAFVPLEKLNELWLGRFVRSLHRYSSDLLVVAILLHAWRVLVVDRFSGNRWLTWVSGMAMLLLVWVIGILGFWLVGDVRGQWIGTTLTEVIGGAASSSFLTNESVARALYLFWLILIFHIGLALFIGVAFLLHTQRISRAKMMPPRYWVYSVLAVVVLLAATYPAILPHASDMTKLPANMPLDFFYLFPLPFAHYLLSSMSGSTLFVFAGVGAAATLFFGVWPWLFRRRDPPAVVSQAACTGCELCAKDCPYDAIIMRPRTDGRQYKLEAVINPAKCVSCGICIGSCSWDAIEMGVYSNAAILSCVSNEKHVVVACERHATLGGLRAIKNATMITAPCVGITHPNLILLAQQNGAEQVTVVGCLPEDCANREGNKWLGARLDGQRKPMLPKNVNPNRWRRTIPQTQMARASAGCRVWFCWR
jgi:ferredoxin